MRATTKKKGTWPGSSYSKNLKIITAMVITAIISQGIYLGYTQLSIEKKIEDLNPVAIKDLGLEASYNYVIKEGLNGTYITRMEILKDRALVKFDPGLPVLLPWVNESKKLIEGPGL